MIKLLITVRQPIEGADQNDVGMYSKGGKKLMTEAELDHAVNWYLMLRSEW